MSYICIIANEKGAVAAGDSRLTLYPAQLNLHLDRTRKVFQDEKQGLVWACCGLTYFGGIHYFKAVERILRSESMTMGAKLNKITTLMERATNPSPHQLLRKLLHPAAEQRQNRRDHDSESGQRRG